MWNPNSFYLIFVRYSSVFFSRVDKSLSKGMKEKEAVESRGIFSHTHTHTHTEICISCMCVCIQEADQDGKKCH